MVLDLKWSSHKLIEHKHHARYPTIANYLQTLAWGKCSMMNPECPMPSAKIKLRWISEFAADETSE
jgi:hypothetical protein